MDAHHEVVLVVDLANVLGSRPDGWWRDRAGASRRLLDALEPLVGRAVAGPPAAEGRTGEPVVLIEVVAVLEGAARAAAEDGRSGRRVRAVLAERDGDTAVVAVAEQVLAAGGSALVVTADRGLRARLPGGAGVVGPGWLNALLGR